MKDLWSRVKRRFATGPSFPPSVPKVPVVRFIDPRPAQTVEHRAWGAGTGRASYAAVQRRRAANRRAAASRRINRRRAR